MNQEITDDFIRNCIDCSVSESDRIEYKAYAIDQNGKMDSENVKKFCEKIVSFLNANGGIILIGIIEENKLPKFADNILLEHEKFDTFKTRLELVFPNYIVPPVNKIKLKYHKIDNHVVISVEIPEGQNKPYSYYDKPNYKYLVRRNSTTAYLSPYEIRDLVLSSEYRQNLIRTIINDRISLIKNGENGVFQTLPVLLMDIIPSNYYRDSDQFNIRDKRLISRISPKSCSNTKYNLDGSMRYARHVNSMIEYCQFFKNGMFEYCNQMCMNIETRDKIHIQNWFKIEDKLYNIINAYLENCDFSTSFVISIGLFNMKNRKISPGNGYNGMTFDRDEMRVDGCIYTDDLIYDGLKPIFDTLANNAGCPESQFFKNK